ncbi:hypothetical protein BJ878DRAFT_478113 [Calycina marina]|uniref:Uncharacterized protein n=1 Tax=Calycina marina TaxID=1763456 RepID=A0A9P7Z810_9HELO|nr:hypothetical protein BJ878DRAFT_478113 [Calycina marina]
MERMPTTTSANIYNAPALRNKTTPLILNLPPAGVHLRDKHPPIPRYLLFDGTREFPVASINYRWNHVPILAKSGLDDEWKPPVLPLSSSSQDFNNHPFPTPLHDTLHAYTWLTEKFLPTSARELDYSSPPTSPYSAVTTPSKTLPRPVIIYGSRLGGILATSVGLTETRSSRLVNQIAGIIVQDGIFDWTHVATSHPKILPKPDMSSTINIRDSEIWAYISGDASSPSPSPPAISSTAHIQASSVTLSNQAMEDLTRSPHPPAISSLHSVKGSLFIRPASCFDPFVSPLLFFRNPGFSVPKHFPGTKPASARSPSIDLAGLSLSDAELADMKSMLGAEDDSSQEKEKEEEIQIRRKSTLKFPPAGSGLKIPRALFLVGQESSIVSGEDKEIWRQTEEIAGQMRRSVVMHECKERRVWDESLDPEAEADDRIQVVELGKDKWEAGIVVGEWLEDVS